MEGHEIRMTPPLEGLLLTLFYFMLLFFNLKYYDYFRFMIFLVIFIFIYDNYVPHKLLRRLLGVLSSIYDSIALSVFKGLLLYFIFTHNYSIMNLQNLCEFFSKPFLLFLSIHNEL